MTEPAVIERFFVCVGAQKAGTTWLARVLARHPDLFMTPVKEIHYFDHIQGLSDHLNDRKRRSRYRKYHQRRWTQLHRWGEYRDQRAWYRSYMSDPIDDAWYRGLFGERNGRAFAGEATPEYALIGESGFQHLKRLAPQVRVLYIVRNPVERAWSQLLHHCRKNRADAKSMNCEQLDEIASSEAFLAHGDYVSVLDALAAAFPADQLAVEFYEDIHADRRAALHRMCGFIGLDAGRLPSEELDSRYNPSQRAVMPDDFRERLCQRYQATAKTLAKRLGRVPEGWRADFA